MTNTNTNNQNQQLSSDIIHIPKQEKNMLFEIYLFGCISIVLFLVGATVCNAGYILFYDRRDATIVYNPHLVGMFDHFMIGWFIETIINFYTVGSLLYVCYDVLNYRLSKLSVIFSSIHTIIISVYFFLFLFHRIIQYTYCNEMYDFVYPATFICINRDYPRTKYPDMSFCFIVIGTAIQLIGHLLGFGSVLNLSFVLTKGTLYIPTPINNNNIDVNQEIKKEKEKEN